MTGSEVVVVGGGHNGLATALVLAREGWRVTVLESRAEAGGLCGGAEFHPGYRHVGIHHDSDRVRPFVVHATELLRHGLAFRPSPPVFVPGATTPASPLGALAATVRPVLEGIFDTPVPAIGPGAPLWPLVRRAVGVRRLGGEAMLELARVGVMAAEDWLSELEPDARRRAAAALPALLGAWMGPRSPHSAGLLLIAQAFAGDEVVGGPAAFVEALLRACASWNVQIRTGAPVRRILVSGGAVRGVLLESGERVDAHTVVSALDPRRTVSLIDGGAVPDAMEEEVRHVRVRTSSAKVHLAWSSFPAFREGPPAERYAVVEDPRALERAFDDAKHGRMPRSPALEVRVPSLAPGATLAPAGHHVASIQVFGAPGALVGGWTEARRQELLDRVLTALEVHQPDVRRVTVGSEVLVGPDLEARYGATGGHPLHGEHALDRLWVGRPGPVLCRHRTPILGFFLATGGVHPFGGCSGAAGVMAARAALESR